MIHLVQVSNGNSRRVALVDEPNLRCLKNFDSIYTLVQASLQGNTALSAFARDLATGDSLDYDSVYFGRSEWHLMTPIDVPENQARVLVSGTGLTHLGSAKDRQAMHAAATPKNVEMTDSMRMFQYGVEGGRPPKGQIGVARVVLQGQRFGSSASIWSDNGSSIHRRRR